MAKKSNVDYVPWAVLGIIVVAILYLLYPASFANLLHTNPAGAVPNTGIGSITFDKALQAPVSAAEGVAKSVDAAVKNAFIGDIAVTSSTDSVFTKTARGVTGFLDKLSLWAKVLGLVIIGWFIYASTRKK